jgi:hypothetical protein
MKLSKYYIRGIAVGLIIAWVAGAIAYIFKKRMTKV